MSRKLINSQISNFRTYKMYERQFLTLAENVFIIDGLDPFVDISYINKILVEQGAIAFFYDEEIQKLLALPFVSIGDLDMYGRPNEIRVMGLNGYQRTLKRDEYVIMYDNNGRYPLFYDVLQYAERISLCARVVDINLRSNENSTILENKTRK